MEKKIIDKRKILNIAYLDFDDIKNPLLGGGQAYATYEVGKRLVERGHKITVFCSGYPGWRDRIQEGIVYKHIGLGTRNIRFNNAVYILVLPFIVSKLKADVIIECFTAPISTLMTPLWTKIPVAAIPSSFEAERFSKLYHLPFHLIEKAGCPMYKYFLPFTLSGEKKMKQFNPAVISRVVPEGVGSEFFTIKRKKPRHILFLGRLDISQKGIDLLIAAYATIADKIKYPLIIAGHGPDEDKIKSLIKKLKLEKTVKMVGSAYGKEKMRLLSESIFVVLPSRNEGFSLFALEALAAGVPLVTFDIAGLSWNKDCGVALKAKPFNIEEYASLLVKLTEEKLNVTMSFSARLFAGKFTWDNVVARYESFFYDVLEKERKYGS